MAHTIFMSLGLLIMNMMSYSQAGYTTYWEQLDLDNNLRVITDKCYTRVLCENGWMYALVILRGVFPQNNRLCFMS